MKKIYIIFICILCVVGCGKNGNYESNKLKYRNNYTHNELIVNTEYEQINSFLNTLFNELNFDGKMRLANSNESDSYYKFTFINGDANTVFTFYFNKEQQFMFVNIIYDKYDNNSLDLSKEVIGYSKFNFSDSELVSIRKILTSSLETDDIEIGNYIVSNLSSGNLIIKFKEKYGYDTLKNVENNTNNNFNNENSNKTNNNGNNNTTNDNGSSNSYHNSQPENNTSLESVSKQNALKKAKSYLSYSAFSRQGLIEQLEFEKFSNEDAIFAVDNVGADWNEQAVKKAQSYLSHSAFSRKGLIEQLEFEGFTSEQADYGVNNVGADWNEQAVKKAKSYLSHSAFSREGLIEQLEFEGFTHDQAVYGVTQNGL